MDLEEMCAVVENPGLATPIGGMGIVIHRGDFRWFVVDDERYELLYHGPGWGWSIHTYGLRYEVADGYHTLAEVRADAVRAVRAFKEAS